MAVQVAVALTITPLADNQIWFANAAAWNNYWADVDGVATFDAAPTNIYVPVPFDDALPPYHLVVDDIQTDLATLAQLTSLKAQVAQLDAAFQDMRTQMKTAGYITQSQ